MPVIIDGAFPTETWPPQQTHRCLDAEGNSVECLTDLDIRPYDFMYSVKCPPSPGAPESAVEAVLYGSCGADADQPLTYVCRATILCREKVVAPVALPEVAGSGVLAALALLVVLHRLFRVRS